MTLDGLTKGERFIVERHEVSRKAGIDEAL